MKLYEILRLEGGPKSSWTGIEELAIAKDDDVIAKYLDNKYDLFTAYTYDEETGEESDEPEFSEETYNEVMANFGNLESEDGWEDAYYGVTKVGWRELSCTIDPIEIETLKELGIKLVEL